MKKIFAILAFLLAAAAHATTMVPSSLINWVTAPSAPSQTAKYVFAAPNGAAGVPTFRQLLASDIPTLAPLASASTTGTWTFAARPTFNSATPWDSANLASPASTTGNLSQFASTTSAQLAALLSDETGTGSNVFGTSPTITTPNLVGITGGTNANAGSIGEYKSSDVPIGTPVALTAGTAANITSVSLTAGDWLCSGTASFLQTSTTSTTTLAAGMNTTSATMPLTEQQGYAALNLAFATGSAYANAITVGSWRYNVTTGTTVYLVAKASFTASTESAYGFLGCYRFH